jgi:catechol 2,3-dioxygenase-like lactoylglutathione lyase family enzyme
MMRIAYALLWVHDQGEALAFHTEKLGWEVRADVTLPEMGNFRWLTVGPGGATRRRRGAERDPRSSSDGCRNCGAASNLMAKGYAGTVLLTSDDVQGSYEELAARGVEFVEPPEGRPYGVDSAFRDPSGNFVRLMQLRELPAD